MKGKWTLLGSILAVLLLALAVGLARAQGPQPPGEGIQPQDVGIQAALGTAFTYQGQLKKAGNPVNGNCDFQFSLYDESGGSPIGVQTTTGITVTNGLFTVQLDFGAGAFQGDARWLQIAVKCAGDTSYVTLSPRQPLTAAPYALFSKAAPWTGLTGVPTGFADNADNDTLGGLSCGSGQVAKWSGSAWACAADNDTTYTAGTGLTLTSNQFSLNMSYTDGRYWKLTGNAGTTPGTHFLGTTDNVSLTLAVNGTAALRLEPNDTSPNVIGGYSGNSVTAGVYGATIGGGGASSVPNRVTGNYGTVGGGSGNTASGYAATVGGGFNNTASSEGATIGGGESNLITATATYGTIGGGYGNTASGPKATVGGGSSNTASAWYATVGGGWNNTASGYAATVPGGRDNTAQGDYSFAAGQRAKASHQGAFVWADSTDADFASTAANQFAVRATGGVSFTTGSNNDFLLNGNKVWNEGNDGSGSGLDADTVDGLHASSFASASLLGSSWVYEANYTQDTLFSMSTTGWAVLDDGDNDSDHTLIITTTSTTPIEYTLWYGSTSTHGEASQGSPATITFPHYLGFQLILARHEYIASLVCNENDSYVACVYQKSHP